MSDERLARILIETPIDQLIDLVRERRKVPLSKAASYLDVPESQVEEWVKVLEEKGFLKLMYPPIGEPYIVLGEMSPAKINHKIKEFERKRDKIGGKVDKMEGKIVKAEKETEITDKKFVRLQEDLYGNLELVERDLRNLDDLDNKRRAIAAGAKEVEEFSKAAVEHFDSVKSNLRELDKRIKEQLEELQKHEGAIGNLESERLRLEREMEVLDKEISLVKKLANIPRAPVLEEFKEILKKQKERASRVRGRKEEIKKKTMEIKKRAEEKRGKVKEKEVDHAKLVLMKLTKPKKIRKKLQKRKRRKIRKVRRRKKKIKIRKEEKKSRRIKKIRKVRKVKKKQKKKIRKVKKGKAKKIKGRKKLKLKEVVGV